MNLQDLKEKVSNNFSAGVLAVTALLTSDNTIGIISCISSVAISGITVYGDYKLKVVNARRIEADTRKVDAEVKRINTEIEEKEKGE